MAPKKGTALLMVFVDIDPEHDADFNAWYDEEHVADLLNLQETETRRKPS